jgi:hypothetical protein
MASCNTGFFRLSEFHQYYPLTVMFVYMCNESILRLIFVLSRHVAALQTRIDHWLSHRGGITP